ncbi:hypothetical protein [Burkholderia pseudomallei]|uniref:hypothetical protein n=1 Tax=Burkholderia pseudomallei TaxID=28450 RepID=UPI00052AAF00|nr:hypothetical protein [Burkholderia pseudomallei]AIV67421.1 hypothetical protein X993_4152 [Burkholderia pseudomallei K42]
MITDDAAAARNRRAERHERRYRKLAGAMLPAWVPQALTCHLIHALESLAAFRGIVRAPSRKPEESHRRCNDPTCFHCATHDLDAAQARVDRLIRLAAYPDMRSAWETVANQNRKRSVYQTSAVQGIDTDGISLLLIDEIHRAIESFGKLPKRTAAHKNRDLNKIARLAKELAKEIDADEDGQRLATEFVANYIGLRNIVFRIGQGEQFHPVHLTVPSQAYRPFRAESERENSNDDQWNNWPAINRLQWLSDDISRISIQDILSVFAEQLASVAQEKPIIGRAGSGDPLKRYLIEKLSEFMQHWFGSPLDQTVAYFVSASLDMETPLTRDDVKPYRKRSAGRN